MVLLRTRNKITDVLMILAWASPFNKQSEKDGIKSFWQQGARESRE